MTSMNSSTNNLARNLSSLRKQHHYSQEKLAELTGVTRQAIAKWETGESTPDILHCDALASLYDVTLDDLIRYDEQKEGIGIPPRNKHLFGTVQLGERGQIVIPKKARDLFGLKHGDTLVVMGDTTPGIQGIALMRSDDFTQMTHQALDHFFGKENNE